MVYNAFSSSVLGMMSQSHALNTIGLNIANVDTGGYKGRDTRFSSLVSDTLYHESDLSGIRPWDFQRIDQQGLLQASASYMDLGINGRGFFTLSDSFGGDGHIFYGRDGSFQMRTVNDVPVTADDGSTITVKDGYLADKNGYFVLGWEPDANGTFPSSGGSLVPLRIDPYAFADVFVPTTTGTLGLNLPAGAATGRTETYSANLVDSAGDIQTVNYSFLKSHLTNQWIVVPKTSGAATAQVDTVTLAGTAEAGDRYSVTINGSAFSHTTQTNAVTLAGTIEAGDSYTVNVDGTPVTYTVQLSQQDTVTLSGTVEAGDIYSVTVNGTLFSYTAAGGETLTDIRDNLMGQINASAEPVTAAASGTDGLTITADVAGTPFGLATAALDGGGTPDNGVATSTTSILNTTMADVRDALVAQINAIPGGTVTASASGADGIVATPVTPGTAFTMTASAANGGLIADNATTSTPETLADVRDDLISQITAALGATVTVAATGTDGMTVTANAAGTPFSLSADAADGGGTADNTAATTTNAIVLTFNADGTLASPANTTMTMTFSGGSTATVDMDLASMTQYAGDLTPITYSRNGYAMANMESFRFDENGCVQGVFGDGSTRTLYKVPLAVFNNPNGLEERNGNVWVPTTESGDPDVVAAFGLGAGSFQPFSHELSNVDIASEFTQMILTQNAYNSSAQVFKTIDEMTQVARDLKR